MRQCRMPLLAATVLASLAWLGTVRADDPQPPTRERPKPEREFDEPGKPPAGGDFQRARRPPPKPEEGDFDRPPPREGEFRRGPHPLAKPGEGDFPRRAHDGEFGRHRRGPPEGGPDLPGPGPWPRENLQWLQRSDPEMAKLLEEDMDLDRQSRELAMQYHRAPPDRRDAIKQQLAEVVGRHFEARQRRRQIELKRLEAEIQGVRESIEKREKTRGEIVQRRLEELIGREDELKF